MLSTTTPFAPRFTPSLLDGADLEALFVQRGALLEDLQSRVRDSVSSAAKHHTLLVGPSGSGKTHLVALLNHRALEAAGLRERLAVAWLSGQQWGITSFLDLLVRALVCLEDPRKPAVAQRLANLYKSGAEAAEMGALSLLREVVGDRTLLLIVESLDVIFDNIGEVGQKRLRAFLQEGAFCTIVATAPSLFGAVSLRTAPFFGFFRIHHLRELSSDEGAELIERRARLGDTPSLGDFLETSEGRARVRAVHHLAGGNHRVFAIMAHLPAFRSAPDLAGPVLELLDELTPYYQGQLGRLSPQQRKIVNLLSGRGAMPVKDLAARGFMTHQTASSQLKILRDLGFVRSTPVGRETYYELQETIMRLCLSYKKRRTASIERFAEFLRSWYRRDPHRARLTALAQPGAVDRDALRGALLRAGREKAAKTLDASDGLEAFAGLETLAQHTSKRSRLRERLVQGAVALTASLWEKDRHEDARELLGRALTATIDDSRIHQALAITLSCLGDDREAVAAIERAFPEDDRWANLEATRALILARLGDQEQALQAIEQARHRGSTAWFLEAARAELLLGMRRWREGIDTLATALTAGASEGADIASLYDARDVVRALSEVGSDPAGAHGARIDTLISLHESRGLSGVLGVALVREIQEIPAHLHAALEATWPRTWGAALAARPELDLARRLAEAALRYRGNKDPRELLGLAAEERILFR